VILSVQMIYAQTIYQQQPSIMATSEPGIAIHRAGEDDGLALSSAWRRSRATHAVGEVLVAEIGGEPPTAIEVASGATVAHPCGPTGPAVDLRVCAAQLRQATVSRRRLRLRARAASSRRSASPARRGLAGPR
jgi:hypothetical protein